MWNAPQLLHLASVGATAPSWVRRLRVRVFDCLLLGCAIVLLNFVLLFLEYRAPFTRWLLSNILHIGKRKTNKMMQRCKAKNDEVANFSELGYGVCRPCLMLWFQNEISVLLSSESSSAEKRLTISALHSPSGCTLWSGKLSAMDS